VTQTIVVEPQGRLAWLGAEEVAAPGRRLGVVDPSEVDDDLVRDGTELLSRLGARLDGRRSAFNWAVRTLEADRHRPGEGCPTKLASWGDPDRCTFGAGTLQVEPDRRHVTLPEIGTVRTCERTRRRERLIHLGRARILAATLRRVGERAVVVLRVELQRPQGCPTRGVPIGARSDGVPRDESRWGPQAGLVGAPVRPGPPGRAARRREAREGNPVRGAA